MLNIYNQKNNNHNNESEKQADSNNLPKPTFTRYTDPTEELGTKEFKWGLWFVQHRVLLYRIIVGILIGLSAIFWIYTLINGLILLTDIFGRGKNLDRDLTYFYDYTVFHPIYSPQPLLIASTQILPGGVNKYDLLGEVSNPNRRFYLELDYHFIVDGITTPNIHTFLLPGENRFLTYLGFSSQEYPGSAELIVTNLRWRRISNHDIVDTISWQSDRLNFLVSDFSFTFTDNGVGPAANIIKFNLKNNSAYSFVNPSFEVGLYQGETLVGILPFKLDRFVSGETRAIDLRSFVKGLNVTAVKIFPLIDVYNNSVYLPPAS